ncbi:MAG: MarC family protein [Phycisphaeraceae bacterium]|nr:MarC family protein [Phycisphaeraceae bacterium]
MTLWAAFITLFLVLDALGNVPTFMVLTGGLSARRRRVVIIRENLIAWLVLAGCLFFGPALFHSMRVSPEAIGIAGGVVMFLIAIRMIFNDPRQIFPTEESLGEPLVVPLAIPLIAGPSAIAIVSMLATREPDRMGTWLLALTLACAASLSIFLAASPLVSLLGERGLRAAQRLMGMLLTVIATQTLIDAAGNLLHD